MFYTLLEHQEKRLVPKEIQERVQITSNIPQENIQKLEESAKEKSKRKLIVQMEAIHVGRTRNYTFYTEEGLKSGLSSWTQPYSKPVLTHHNDWNGEPIGRILKAEFSDKTLSGKSGLIFTCEITDPDAIEKVLDGRYQTVSIGATTDKVTCNICGTDRTEEWCDHFPGEIYEDQKCHFIIGTTYGREVSYVNTPSDEYAGNISVQVAEDDGKTNESMKIYQMAEGLYQDAQNPDVNIYEHLNDEIKEMLDSMMKEKGENAVGDKQEDLKNPEESVQQSSVQESNINEDQDVNENHQETDEASVQDDNDLEIVKRLVKENLMLKDQISQLQEEKDQLIQENSRLVQEAHKQLVEKIVDLKISLQKQDVLSVTREEAIAKHMSRTKESLQDTLEDLLAESKTINKVEPGSVKNPGVSDIEEQEKDETITLQEGVNLIKNLFK